MEYLNLQSNCITIFGENGALIYNVENGNYYSLDKRNSKILKKIKAGLPIVEIKREFEKDEVEDFLKNLINSELASFSKTYSFQESFRVGNAKPPIDLEFKTCYIELPLGCTENCKHCDEAKTTSCLTCNKPDYISKNIDLKFYKTLLSELLKTSVKSIIFHGGDPLTNESEVLALLKFARESANEDVQIILKTNGLLFNERQIRALTTYRVNPLIVFNIVDLEDLSLRLKNMQSFLKLLSKGNIDFYGNLTIGNPGSQYQKNFIELLQLYNFSKITTSIIISANKNLQKYAKINFSWELAYNFSANKNLHPCLNGTLAITSDRKIVPCPSMKERILLDLNQSDFMHISDSFELIDKYWRFNLQQVDKCKLCKFRYSCTDCRAIEEILANSQFKKKICYLAEECAQVNG